MSVLYKATHHGDSNRRPYDSSHQDLLLESSRKIKNGSLKKNFRLAIAISTLNKIRNSNEAMTYLDWDALDFASFLEGYRQKFI